ncbi:MAG TPA: hypothetical protein VM934_15385 [Pyrinomonadaceae bacterium]|nr:hypothetical protein [Pyrinomonadaceae bacterium]
MKASTTIMSGLRAASLFLVALLSFALHAHAQAVENGAASAPSPARLEELLKRAPERIKEYLDAFANLTAEEVKTIEIYDREGRQERLRRIVSDFVVYQSQLDGGGMAEYRNVREVDGRSIADRDKRLLKIFERAPKAGSVTRELERIDREGSRYDVGYVFTGMTLNQGTPLHDNLRDAFSFEAAGEETVDGRPLLIVRYEQVKPHPQIKFNLSLPSKLKPSEPTLRGRLWLDPATAQLWQEERELVVKFDAEATPRPFMLMEFQYRPGRFPVPLPRVVRITTYNHLSLDKNKRVALMPGGRVTFTYGPFTKFDVSVGEEKLAPTRAN